MKNNIKTCCICGKTFEGLGNTPSPVKEEGTCCSLCNDLVVIPARIDAMMTSNSMQPDELSYNYGIIKGGIDRIMVGEISVCSDSVPTGTTGTISVFQGEVIHVVYCCPRSAPFDIETFKNTKIEIGYIGVKAKGLTMPVIRIGHHYLEIPFNLNAVPNNGYKEFSKSSCGAIVLQYVNSITQKVEAIRFFYPEETLKQALMEVGLATIDKKTTPEQYQQWVGEVFAGHTAKDSFKRSRKLGYVKGGLTPSCWMNLSPSLVLSEG